MVYQVWSACMQSMLDCLEGLQAWSFRHAWQGGSAGAGPRPCFVINLIPCVTPFKQTHTLRTLLHFLPLPSCLPGCPPRDGLFQR